MRKNNLFILLFISVGILLSLPSCSNNDDQHLNLGKEEQEVFTFPIELYPVEISNILETKFFIGGKQVFDTILCKSFMRSEWIKMFDGSQQYDFFDETNFIKDYIPKKIAFIAHDTAIIDYSYFTIDRKKSFFVFTSEEDLNSTNNFSRYFKRYLDTKQTAKGDYKDLEYNIVNYRYTRNFNDTPFLKDHNAGMVYYGTVSRIEGEINYKRVVDLMHPTDTFVFQQYQVKYQILKHD